MTTNKQDLVTSNEPFEEYFKEDIKVGKQLYDINFSIGLLHRLLERIPNIPPKDLKLTLEVNIKQILAALEIIAFNMDKN